MYILLYYTMYWLTVYTIKALCSAPHKGRNVVLHKLQKHFRERGKGVSVCWVRDGSQNPPPSYFYMELLCTYYIPGLGHTYTISLASTPAIQLEIVCSYMECYWSSPQLCHPAVRKDKVQLSMDKAVECGEARHALSDLAAVSCWVVMTQ